MDKQQIMKERFRERRRKILSNAKSRMDKLRNVQQWSERKEEQGVECEPGESDEGNRRRCEGEETGSRGKQSEQVAEDPPDELLLPPTNPAPITTHPAPPSPSYFGAWVATLHDMLILRTLFISLTCAVAAWVTVVFGYSVPCLLCLLTSELCLLLWALIMSRGTPSPRNDPVGTVGVLKLALVIVYPPASRLLDHIHHSLRLWWVVVQDLCVGLFCFVSVTVLCHLIQSTAGDPAPY